MVSHKLECVFTFDTPPVKFQTVIFALTFYLFSAVSVNAAELITSFDSRIEIGTDAVLTITETIVVNAEGRDIKRGIYRDFPTEYTDSEGVFHKNGFSIISVQRNGSPEDYHQQKNAGSIRIYFGNKNRLLSQGEHTYIFTYRTTNQLRFFKAHDELYWNVTGNEWVFPIEQASATIVWPDNIDINQVDTVAFTGRKGVTEKNYKLAPADGQIVFETTTTLKRYEGLTIAAKWPKGLIAEPAGARPSNRYYHASIAGIASLFAFYLFNWFRKGKDPASKKITPQFMPDYEHSPAAVRYVNNMGYDTKTFTVAIVSMAVKGLLRIRDDDGKYTLEKTEKDVDLYNDEYEAKGKIFLSKNSFKVDSKSHWTMRRALSRHELSLFSDYDKDYFSRNTNTFWTAQLISLFTLVLMYMYATEHGKSPEYIFSLFIAGGWTVMVIILLPAFIRLWRGERSLRLYTRLLLGFLLPAVFMMLMTGTKPSNLFSLATLRLLLMNSVLPLMLALLAINAAFFYWMKAPTEAGRDMLDKIKSFKFYMRMANEGRIEFDEALRLTPEDYDRYLPYAMALDFESEWGEFVHNIFSKIGSPDSRLTQPDWYDGDSFNDRDFSRFTRNMGTSLSSSFASASVNPTTSSSSGGGSSGFSGGSSGGGGGGGGGGGW